MNLTSLKEKIYDNLLHAHVRMQELQAKTITGLLSVSAFWPIIAAAQQGDMQTILAFMNLAGGIGTNLLSEKLGAWQASFASEQGSGGVHRGGINRQCSELRSEMEVFLDKLEVITEALKRQR